MGIVWRAQDAVLDREVAVGEVFPPTMAEEERRLAQAQVLRETRAAARLDFTPAWSPCMTWSRTEAASSS